ncbi:MAG: DinB family protein [Cyclobacteriaceae bacterium]
MNINQKLLEKYNQLEKDNLAIISKIESFPVDLHDKKPTTDSWNIIQVLNHVKGAEEGTLGYIKKKLHFGGIPKADFTAPLRVLAMKTLLYSPIRYKMPAVLKQPSDQGSLESIKTEWDELRLKWRELINEFPEENQNLAVFKHPIFGRLKLNQAIDSMIAHQSHHEKQVNRILKAVS